MEIVCDRHDRGVDHQANWAGKMHDKADNEREPIENGAVPETNTKHAPEKDDLAVPESQRR